MAPSDARPKEGIGIACIRLTCLADVTDAEGSGDEALVTGGWDDVMAAVSRANRRDVTPAVTFTRDPPSGQMGGRRRTTT